MVQGVQADMNIPHRLAIFVCAFLLGSQGLLHAGGSKNEDARAMLVRAAALSNLDAKGNPPFKLEAKVTLHNGDGITEVSYLRLWASEDKWRIETSAPDFHSLNGKDGDKAWHVGDHPYFSFVLSETLQMLDAPGRLKLNEKAGASKHSSRESNGISMSCVQEKVKGTKGTTYCFDTDTGALAEEDVGFPKLVRQYRDYKPFGQLSFPRSELLYFNGTLVAEVQVQELEQETDLSESFFKPPPGSVAQYLPVCNSHTVQAARRIFGIQPQYPPDALRKRETGRVRFWAIVGTDGRLHQLTVLQSAGPGLDAAALQAVSRWRYQPISCDGKTVDVVTEIDVDFQLR
ncbi:MAG: TonB family protein [Terriglobia bacterium]